MLRSFDNLDRDHRGYNTSGALLGVVESLSLLPGRKTIVFFSEGLPVSPALAARLDNVIEAANRANVTAYAIDAHGLRTRTAATTMKKEMDGFVDDRFSQLSSGSDRTNQPLTMAFERVEDTLNLDSRTGLAKLAEDTGGFLVENSNDSRRRVQAHRRRQPVSLPADLLPSECRLRWQVPGDSGQSAPAVHAGLRQAAAIARSARRPDVGHGQLRGPGARHSRRRTAAERIPGSRGELQLPGSGTARPDPAAGTRPDRGAPLCRRRPEVDLLQSGRNRGPGANRRRPRGSEAEPAIPAVGRRAGRRGGDDRETSSSTASSISSQACTRSNRSCSTRSRDAAARGSRRSHVPAVDRDRPALDEQSRPGESDRRDVGLAAGLVTRSRRSTSGARCSTRTSANR